MIPGLTAKNCRIVEGFCVIHTPRHTPGHISLYLKQTKTLIAGDSMYSIDGVIGGIHAPTVLDFKETHSL